MDLKLTARQDGDTITSVEAVAGVLGFISGNPFVNGFAECRRVIVYLHARGNTDAGVGHDELDLVPVFIGRRLHESTDRRLGVIGHVIHDFPK